MGDNDAVNPCHCGQINNHVTWTSGTGDEHKSFPLKMFHLLDKLRDDVTCRCEGGKNPNSEVNDRIDLVSALRERQKCIIDLKGGIEPMQQGLWPCYVFEGSKTARDFKRAKRELNVFHQQLHKRLQNASQTIVTLVIRNPSLLDIALTSIDEGVPGIGLDKVVEANQ